MSLEIIFESPKWAEFAEQSPQGFAPRSATNALPVAADGEQAYREICQSVERRLLEEHGVDPSFFNTNILLCDDARMRALNQRFRAKDKATNVLSFPAMDFKWHIGEGPNPGHDDGATGSPPGEPIHLGDIALGFESCAREAADIGLKDHFTHLVAHGFLHLLGYDHEDEDDADIMEQCEIRLLGALDIKNPYAAETPG